jgi:hypothetical protein
VTARPGPGTPGSVVYGTDHRRGLGAFMAPGSATDPLETRSGIVHAPGSPLRVRQNTPLGMSALVNPGNAEVHRAGRGPYMPYNDAVDTVTFDPAPATNSRYDLVYISQADSDVDASSATTLGVLKGTATASAPKPYGDLPAGGLVLAEVGPIAVGTTQITDALITNVAPFAAVRGTPIPVRSQAERDALSEIASAACPITVERLDTGTIERNTGAGWVAFATSTTVAALASRVAALEATVPSGRLIRSVATSIPNAAWTEIGAWSSGATRAGMGYDSPRYKAIRPGLYLFSCMANWAGNNAGRRGVSPTVNGANPASTGDQSVQVATTAAGINSTTSTVLLLDAGDTVNMMVYQDSGAALNVSSCSFSLAFVGN